MISITQPAAESTVEVHGALGYVSVSGSATAGSEYPDEVYGKVNADDADTSPPQDATELTVSSLGAWSGDVPGADCDASGVDNTLYVWARYFNQTNWERATVMFKGQC
jgi:hypothetical protein